MRRLIARIFAGITICVAVLILVAIKHVQEKAASLLSETVALKPDDKIELVRQNWKREFGPYYVESNDHSFGVHIQNSVVSRFRILNGAFLGVDLYGRSGKLTDLNLLYYGGDGHAPSAIDLHEYFSEPAIHDRCTIRLQRSDEKLWRAFLKFGYQNRSPSFFAIHLNCLSSLRGCETPDRFLPSLGTLESSCTQISHDVKPAGSLLTTPDVSQAGSTP